MVPSATGENASKMLRSVVLHTLPPATPGSWSTCCDIIQAVRRQCSPQLVLITAESSNGWGAHVRSARMTVTFITRVASSTGFNGPFSIPFCLFLVQQVKKKKEKGPYRRGAGGSGVDTPPLRRAGVQRDPVLASPTAPGGGGGG